jgi:hypothetical protein
MENDNRTILIGVANQSAEISKQVKELVQWEPKKISHFGPTTYFQHEDVFYSMSTVDFKKIYGQKTAL